jgi:hypothetical protein
MPETLTPGVAIAVGSKVLGGSTGASSRQGQSGLRPGAGARCVREVGRMQEALGEALGRERGGLTDDARKVPPRSGAAGAMRQQAPTVRLHGIAVGMPLIRRGVQPRDPASPTILHYWSDEVGFNRKSFNKDYAKERKKVAAQAGKKIRQGNRLRIEAISCALDKCLETNLYALPTKKASYLAEDDKDWRIFEYLFRVIRPRVVSVHSVCPIKFFKAATGCRGFEDKSNSGPIQPQRAEWQGHGFYLLGRRGRLTGMSGCRAKCIGQTLAGLLRP